MARSPARASPSGIVSGLSMRTRLQRLLALAQRHKRAVVLTHDNPDPDSLASAVGLAQLLEQKAGLPATIAFGGIVGRAENTAMIRVLDLPVVPIADVRVRPGDLFALVDTQPPAGNHSLPRDCTASVVIDHHPAREGTELAPYADVGHTGATCTIVVEYLRAARVGLSPETATALFYGIKADTRDLDRQTHPLDLDSYLYLLPRVDRAALARIEHPALPAAYFRLYHLAIERARVHGTAVQTNLGGVYSPDMVAEVAERLLSLEGMRWSLAYGTWHGGLYLSLRTNDRRMNAGRIIRKLCADLGGSAGGHGSMAGARLPMPAQAAARKRKIRALLQRFLEEFGVADEKPVALRHQP